MHHRYRPLLVALLSVFALATWVMAGLPTFWTLESQPEFLTGDVDGLSIASDGVISLAPATQNLYESTDPFFWSLVSDREGNLYAGSGNNGKVYKIDREGTTRVLVDTNELEVHGLALDPRRVRRAPLHVNAVQGLHPAIAAREGLCQDIVVLYAALLLRCRRLQNQRPLRPGIVLAAVLRRLRQELELVHDLRVLPM